MIDPLWLLVFFVLGGIVGWLGGYAGIGGAPFLVAALVLSGLFEQHKAQGTVLAVMLGPMTLPAMWAMRDRIRKMLAYSVIGVVTYAIFSYVGAAIAYLFNGVLLGALFGGVLVLIGLRYLWPSEDDASVPPFELAPGKVAVRPALIPFNYVTIGLLGIVVGIVGGMFGIGAGVLIVPILIQLFGVHKDDARTISLTMLAPPVSIGAVLQYQSRGDIDWIVAGVLLASYLVANLWGARSGRDAHATVFARRLGLILFGLGLVLVLLQARAYWLAA